MKSKMILLLSIFLFGLLSCEKTDTIENPENKVLNCEDRPEWQGFNEECGCFGTPFGFSGWCVPAKGGEITYFAKTSFHHIQDSLCLIYSPDSDFLGIINVNEKGYRSDELGTTVSNAIERKWTLIYEYEYSDIKDPSEDLLKSESQIELDPNLFDINANEMRIMAYQYRTGVPGNIKLDSVEIVFVKQLNRK